MRNNHNIKGFTLVELSIVLVIVGLLIGGILVGQSLIVSAKLQRTVREIEAYQVSINQFGAKYRGVPGDFIRAIEFLGAATSGNGDGSVDCCTSAVEYVNAFNHLSLAGLLPKKYNSGRGDLFNSSYGFLELGWNVPKLNFEGLGLMLAKQGTSGCQSQAYNTPNCLAIGARTDNSSYGDALINFSDVLHGASLNGPDMMALDQKIDDGKPYAGIFRGLNAYRVSKVNSNTNCVLSGNYVTLAESGCRASMSLTVGY